MQHHYGLLNMLHMWCVWILFKIIKIEICQIPGFFSLLKNVYAYKQVE